MVTRSIAEAGYRSFVMTICEVMCIKQLLKELGLKYLGTTNIFCDNQVAIAIVANLVHHAKTKNVRIDCHFIMEKAMDGVAKPTYVHTSQQLVDILTKVLSVEQQTKLLNQGGSSLYSSKLEGER